METKRVKLITGAWMTVREENLVGHCNYHLHRGYVTKTLLKTHQCVEKHCPQLVRLRPGFWKPFEDARQKRVENRAKIRAGRKDERNLLLEIYDAAYAYVDERDYPIEIIRVQRMKPGVFYLFYVSDSEDLDYREYLELSDSLREWYGYHFFLRRIVRPDGKYATLADFGFPSLFEPYADHEQEQNEVIYICEYGSSGYVKKPPKPGPAGAFRSARTQVLFDVCKYVKKPVLRATANGEPLSDREVVKLFNDACSTIAGTRGLRQRTVEGYCTKRAPWPYEKGSRQKAHGDHERREQGTGASHPSRVI